jgi:hypothetical protein
MWIQISDHDPGELIGKFPMFVYEEMNVSSSLTKIWQGVPI